MLFVSFNAKLIMGMAGHSQLAAMFLGQKLVLDEKREKQEAG